MKNEPRWWGYWIIYQVSKPNASRLWKYCTGPNIRRQGKLLFLSCHLHLTALTQLLSRVKLQAQPSHEHVAEFKTSVKSRMTNVYSTRVEQYMLTLKNKDIKKVYLLLTWSTRFKRHWLPLQQSSSCFLLCWNHHSLRSAKTCWIWTEIVFPFFAWKSINVTRLRNSDVFILTKCFLKLYGGSYFK